MPKLIVDDLIVNYIFIVSLINIISMNNNQKIKSCKDIYGENSIDVWDDKCICDEWYVLNYNKICTKDRYYEMNMKMNLFFENSFLLLFIIWILLLIYISR